MKTIAEGTTLTIKEIKEVTSRNAGELDERIAGQTTSKIQTIDIDLSDATFLDNIGLSTLVKVHNQATRENRRVRLINPAANVLDILEFTELDHTFEMVF